MESHTTASATGASLADTEHTPLLQSDDQRPKPSRSVTFSANPVTRTIEPEQRQSMARSGQHGSNSLVHGTPSGTLGGPPMLAALNSRLRRHSSHGSMPMVAPPALGPKIGPQRSTKKTEKLKLLPNPDFGEEGQDEESGRDVYAQYTRIKDPNARRDAARLGKADRDRLPRVTAYCTANRYEMDGLLRFLKGRSKTKGANPKLIDECIFTPYSYQKNSRTRSEPPLARHHPPTDGETAEEGQRREEMIDAHSEGESERGYRNGFPDNANRPDTNSGRLSSDDFLGPSVTGDGPSGDRALDFDIEIHTPEVFLFDYGVVVIWGMTEAQETRFLKEISKFELEKLAPDDVETEHFNFYYTREYQARIYNDFITLRDKNNYMTKLAISHALAQSVKASLVLFVDIIAFADQ